MKNKIVKYIGYFITLAAFIFIGKSLMSMNFNTRYITNPVYAIVLGTILSFGYAIVVYISSYAWKTTLEFINMGKIPLLDIVKVYVKSNIGKYLPGNVMHFAGRNILAGKLGFKQLDIAFCSIIEIVMLIITDCILSFIFAFKSFKKVLISLLSNNNHQLIYIIFLIAVLAVAILIYILIKKTNFINNYKQFFTIDFFKLLCKLFCIYSITLIIPGLFLIVIFRVVLGCSITPSISMIIISAYTISWVSGFVVPGAPGGIGVRESVFILILNTTYSNDIVLLASIFLRITSVLGDLIAFMLEPAVTKFWSYRVD